MNAKTFLKSKGLTWTAENSNIPKLLEEYKNQETKELRGIANDTTVSDAETLEKLVRKLNKNKSNGELKDKAVEHYKIFDNGNKPIITKYVKLSDAQAEIDEKIKYSKHLIWENKNFEKEIKELRESRDGWLELYAKEQHKNKELREEDERLRRLILQSDMSDELKN